MTKFKRIGMAAVLLSVLASPVLARHAASSARRLPRASSAQPGNREIPTANTAIISNGPNGGSEAVGTPHSTMPAITTRPSYRESAALTKRAKCCLEQPHKLIGFMS